MHFRFARRWFAVAIGLTVVLVAIGAYISLPRSYVLMATTTSTRDTGLLPYLLPQFTADTGIDVRYTAVGTGQALDAGRRADVDVVMVHAPSLEEQFMAQGNGLCRNLIMFNTFVVVGPASDPAGIRNATSATDAFRRIYNASARFESRADASGTYTKEMQLWASAGLNASTFGPWYEKTDQGMGATLTISDQRNAYTLSDDGTWYALEPNLSFTRLLNNRTDAILRNQYAVIPVSRGAHPTIPADRAADALEFAQWLVSPRGQGLITKYAVNGHHVFTADAEANASNPEACL